MRHRIVVVGFCLAVVLLIVFSGLSQSRESSWEVEIDSLNVRRVGRALFEPFGATWVMDGTYFVISYNDLVLFDVNDPSDPYPYEYHPLSGTPRDLWVDEGYVYITMSERGFAVLDREGEYRELSRYDPDVRVYRSVVSGDVAYLICGDSLHIVDVSDRSDIRLAGKYSPVSGVDVRDDICYAAITDYGLRVLEMSDPGNPEEIGEYYDPEGYFRVAVSESLAYGLDWKRLAVLDIGDLDVIEKIGEIDLDYSYTTQISLYDGYALITAWLPGGGQGGLHVIDVSSPEGMEEVSYVPMGNVIDLSVGGRYAYMSNEFGFKVVDLEDPENPVEVGYYDGDHFINNIDVVGDYCYLADYSIYSSDDGLRIVDVSDPVMPVEVGFEAIKTLRDVEVVLPYAYCATESLGLMVYDVSDPGNIVKVGEMSGMDYSGRGLAVDYPYVYLALQTDNVHDGMMILDVSDPDSIAEVSYFETPQSEEVYVEGGIAYLAGAFYGVYIIDVSDPRAPRELSRVSATDMATDVEVVGDYLYIAEGRAGVRIIDVSDPENPEQRGQAMAGYSGRSLHVAYPYLYYTGRGLSVIDVSDPENPEEVGYYRLASPTGVDSRGEYIYLGTGAYGFYVLRFEPVGMGGGGGGSPWIPGVGSLGQNYPNPFNPETTIRFEVPGGENGRAHVSLRVYDLRGRLVRTLVDEELLPGRHEVVWDGRDEEGRRVPSGLYLYRLGLGGRTVVRKMTVLR
jgi:hypothetical protein